MSESQFEQDLYQLRRDKLRQIAAIVRAQSPGLTELEATYPNSYPFTHTIPQLRAAFDPASTEDLAAAHPETSIAGRIMAIRLQGKAGFAQLQQAGQRIQLYVRKDDVGEDAFALYRLLDLGDHIGVRGFLMRTRTGELTVHVIHITFLAKAMLALPDKYHGLEDNELRYRQRYLDLFMNTGATKSASPATERGTNPNATAATEPDAPSSPAHLRAKVGEAPPKNEIVILSEAKDPRISPEAPPNNEIVILSKAKDLLLNPSESPQPSPETANKTPVILSEAQSAQSKDPEAPHAATTAENRSATAPPQQDVRATFVKRAHILRSIRHFFDTRGYLEVETPMLHTIAGGAAARPFTTHHNALDIDLKLRIAPELYLKRLVVGGFDRVYEINRNFRNEGISTQHNPEFTMLEFYQAYSNYHDLMDLTQELITTVAQEVNGTTLTTFNNTEIDLSKWTKLSMRQAIHRFWNTERLGEPPAMDDFQTSSSLITALSRVPEPTQSVFRVETWSKLSEEAHHWALMQGKMHWLAGELRKGAPLGKIIANLFETVGENPYEPHLIQPTIIYDFPLAVSPLSKQKPDEPDWVERFEFYIGGFEVGNAFSELNDPDDQLRRFEAQLEDRKRGDVEAMAEVDEDYVRALGYGLPPTAGEGIGIDRLTMVLTGSRSIRDVILFPLLRPHPKSPTQTS